MNKKRLNFCSIRHLFLQGLHKIIKKPKYLVNFILDRASLAAINNSVTVLKIYKSTAVIEKI
jgi:hypothetical protein